MHLNLKISYEILSKMFVLHYFKDVNNKRYRNLFIVELVIYHNNSYNLNVNFLFNSARRIISLDDILAKKDLGLGLLNNRQATYLKTLFILSCK